MAFRALGEDRVREGSEVQATQQEHYGKYSQEKRLYEIEEVAGNSQENTIQNISFLDRCSDFTRSPACISVLHLVQDVIIAQQLQEFPVYSLYFHNFHI